MSFLTPTTNENHRLLGTYIYYRLGLGLILGVLHWTGISVDVFGNTHPKLFSDIAIFYIVVCSVSIVLYKTNTLKTLRSHILYLLTFDFLVITSFIFASGSLLSGGLAYLLLIPMAVGSTFLSGQANIALAAFGTLLVLIISIISNKLGSADNSEFFAAGVTGTALFVTAITFRLFSEKVKASEDTAIQQTQQANYLQLISQRIVETMRTGIIVIDRDLRIQLINNSAAVMLTVNHKFEGVKGIPEINSNLKVWQDSGLIPEPLTITLGDNKRIKISFAHLNDTRFPSIMLFIEDLERLGQEAQQLKLASLGGLTASIAHEIRNPLGAISHASQLLNESKTISTEDEQLLKIIHNNSLRINFIINNILDFSRRKNATPQIIDLNLWLTNFKNEFIQHKSGHIELSFNQDSISGKIDSTHLHQIITNLVENGMRYSLKHIKKELVHIVLDIDTKSRRPVIEIIDYGQGIAEEDQNHLFEPFYTTEVTGTGLGLYLCKELSEANQANLSYYYDIKKSNSIFKLLLAHPQKRIELE